MKLPEIKARRKEGYEKFTFNGKELHFNIKDFWSWNQSDLLENRTRGILSEFIIKQALDIKSDQRIEWDHYDLMFNKGNKIEVKSAAYIQTREQQKYSTITFRTINRNYGPSGLRWV